MRTESGEGYSTESVGYVELFAGKVSDCESCSGLRRQKLVEDCRYLDDSSSEHVGGKVGGCGGVGCHCRRAIRDGCARIYIDM